MAFLPRDPETIVERAAAGPVDREELLKEAEAGILSYLKGEKDAGRIAETYYGQAVERVVPNLRSWYLDETIDRTDRNLRQGVTTAIRNACWEALVNTYLRRAPFSATGGLRALMASDKHAILALKRDGLEADYLKGPATINDVVVALTSLGVARYGRDKGFSNLVVGCDSRVRGMDFAWLVARVFLAHGFRVSIFDEPCMYPNITFGVPTLRADVGIFISASHNDYRYNGFKITSPNGAALEMSVRDEMFDAYISKTEPKDLTLADLAAVPKEQLWFLGGEPTGNVFQGGAHAGFPVGAARKGTDYLGRDDQIIDIHSLHIKHIRKFLHDEELLRRQRDNPRRLSVAYSAYHGSGRRIVPWLLREVGIVDLKVIKKFDDLDGMFPTFNSSPGREQQPDPGDARAADVAVAAFKEEYPDAWENLDVLVGTDPDADRCGIVVKLPERERPFHDNRDYLLLPADDAWALVVWHLLQREAERHGGVRGADTKYVSLTHTTNEIVARVARKFGLGVARTWVGFVMLGSAARHIWEHKSVPELWEGRTDPDDPRCHPFFYGAEDMNNGARVWNVAAVEQSAGMSIFGGPPKDARSLGEGGHVRDKDGTFASMLLVELAAYAKDRGTTLVDMLNRMYLDPDIGLFVNSYEPDPLDGAYPGLQGDSHKRDILVSALALHERVRKGEPVTMGGRRVASSVVFWTGKYDAQNWERFPDEGLRFYFDDAKLSSVIVRPSGTANAMRLHVQLHEAEELTEDTLRPKKAALLQNARRIVDDIREQIGAPRGWRP